MMGNTFGDGKCRGPLIAENIETNTAVGVDIGVINSGCKVHLEIMFSDRSDSGVGV